MKARKRDDAGELEQFQRTQRAVAQRRNVVELQRVDMRIEIGHRFRRDTQPIKGSDGGNERRDHQGCDQRQRERHYEGL